MSINKRIKNIRKYYKMSQIDFSKEINIKQASLSQIETGIIAPSLDTLRLIIGRFNISYDWLIDGGGEMIKSEKHIGNYSQGNTSDVVEEGKVIYGIEKNKDKMEIAYLKNEIEILQKQIQMQDKMITLLENSNK